MYMVVSSVKSGPAVTALLRLRSLRFLCLVQVDEELARPDRPPDGHRHEKPSGRVSAALESVEPLDLALQLHVVQVLRDHRLDLGLADRATEVTLELGQHVELDAVLRHPCLRVQQWNGTTPECLDEDLILRIGRDDAVDLDAGLI